MTKLRAPLSVEQALQRIAGQLEGGVAEMARLAQRQPCTIRAWMDPDRPEQVSLEAAIELDLAFQAADGIGAPLFEAYSAQLDLAEARRFSDNRRLLDYAQGVIKEGGEAHVALVACLRPGATPQDFRFAVREATEAWEKLRDIIPPLQARAEARPP